MNPIACERLRRVAVEWLVQKGINAVINGFQSSIKTNQKSIRRQP
jgi:hypothetical protein